jgi:hypothetical protein
LPEGRKKNSLEGKELEDNKSFSQVQNGWLRVCTEDNSIQSQVLEPTTHLRVILILEQLGVTNLLLVLSQSECFAALFGKCWLKEIPWAASNDDATWMTGHYSLTEK